MSEWHSAREIADMCLPGLPHTERSIQRIAAGEGWDLPEAEGRTWRRRQGRGGGVEFHVSVLPLAARAKLALGAAQQAARPAPRAAAQAALSHEEAWAWFERLPGHRQAEARERLATLDAVATITAHDGTSRTLAMQMVATERGLALRTLYDWDALVRDVPREHRLPRLAPRHAGRTCPRAAASPEALAWLRAFWLSPSRPAVDLAIRKLREVAPGKGWTLPSDRTLRRHLDAIDVATATFHREGPDAADRLFPALRRDRGALHALEIVNADGHRFDVMVEWPDGLEARPMATCFQDVYSGKFLSWRIDRTENTETFRLAFADVVERFGIPDHVFIDNTLAAANKTMSGGVPHRHRFKRRPEEPLGIFPQLDVQTHFTKPYSGQSKPIERGFRDFAQDIARLPEFEGAYLGNTPEAKPHNRHKKAGGGRAVPLAEFLRVLEREIAAHNARPGRRAPVCKGRSFDATFAESYAEAPIRRATAAQRRMCLLAAEAVTVRQDGTVHLLGNRYHEPQLVNLIGKQVVLRFDPEALHGSVHVFRLDEGFVCEAPCYADSGFADVEEARRIGRIRQDRRKAVRLLADAEKRLTAEQLARDLRDAPAPAADPTPAPRVVRPLFRARGNAALAATPAPETEESEAHGLLRKAFRQQRDARGGHLSVVPEARGAFHQQEDQDDE